MPKKQITKEDLARMIKRGFYGLGKRFNSLDKRFDGIESRFDGMELRFDRIDKKLDKLEQGQKEIIQILDKGRNY